MVTFICGLACLAIAIFLAPLGLIAMNKEPSEPLIPTIIFAIGVAGSWFMLATFTDIEPPFGIGYKEKDVDYYYNHLAEAQQKEFLCRGTPNQSNECYSARAALRRFNTGR